MRSIRLAAFVAAALLAGCGTSGTEPSSAAAVSDAALSVGDCFDSPVSSLVGAHHDPCTEAHAGEVTAVVTFPGDPSATFPSTEALNAFATADCGAAFQAYTGLPFEHTPDLIDGFLAPSQDEWAKGGRTVVCYVRDPNGQSLTQPMRSASP